MPNSPSLAYKVLQKVYPLALKHLRPLFSLPWQAHWSKCHHLLLAHPSQPPHWSSCYTLAPPAVYSLHGSWKNLSANLTILLLKILQWLPCPLKRKSQCNSSLIQPLSRRSSSFLPPTPKKKSFCSTLVSMLFLNIPSIIPHQGLCTCLASTWSPTPLLFPCRLLLIPPSPLFLILPS